MVQSFEYYCNVPCFKFFFGIFPPLTHWFLRDTEKNSCQFHVEPVMLQILKCVPVLVLYVIYVEVWQEYF